MTRLKLNQGVKQQPQDLVNEFDWPEQWFQRGDAEETAENHLKHLEGVLLGELVQAAHQRKTREAGQHIQGCARRLLMMQFARIEILATAKEQEKPLQSHQQNLQNVCLNSYYLNLLGALDNLAWSVAYELKLRPIMDEDIDEVRKLCSFTSREFLPTLRGRSAEFADWLAPRLTWIRDLKRFRDPAAHRLPLTIARGIMTEEEGLRYQQLSRESWDAALRGDWAECERLDAEVEALGRYVPLLDGPRAPNNGMYIVPNQMASDQREFLRLAHEFLPRLAKAAV